MEKTRTTTNQDYDDEDEDTFSFAAICIQEKNSLCSANPMENSNSDSKEISPADIYFSNGLLQPHSFPSQSPTNLRIESANVSRTGSFSTVASKDSLTSSSRNSSGGSSSSQSSSARERDSRKAFKGPKINAPRKQVRFAPDCESPTRQPVTPSSRATVMPSSKGKVSWWSKTRSSATPVSVSKDGNKRRQKAQSSSWLGGKFFRSITSACPECHAVEPEVLHGKRRLSK